MSLRIHDLTCENQALALGVSSRHPVFGWKLSSEENGARQTAYRIYITDEDGKTLWDSGKVTSAQQFDVEMGGNESLQPMSRYNFNVMVWDEKDKPSPWAKSWFLTGFLKVHQWTAKWFRIYHGAIHFFRTEFALREDAAIDYAYLFIGAFGEKMNSCTAYLNGHRVGEMANFPGATEYFRAVYTCVDVASLLLKGVNALGLVAAKSCSLLLKVRYIDGTETFVGTDPLKWSHAVGGPYTRIGYDEPIAHGRLEEYDARKAFAGWSSPGYDDSAWHRETELPIPFIDYGPLFLKPQYCLAVTRKVYRPTRIIKNEDGWFVDFGENMSGFVSLNLKGHPGETIIVKYAEKLDESRTRAEFNEWKPCYLKYTFATDENEAYTPCFMHTGFRCVEIYGYSGQVTEDSISALFVHSDVEDHSSFNCSDPVFNRLYHVARQSFLSNILNIPTDCPERERRGWTADTYSVSEAECINFNMQTFFDQWLESMRDCQRGNGWIPVELPLCTDDSVDIDWPAAAVLIPYDVYMQYGSLRACRRYYPMMKGWVDLLLSICDDDYSMCDSFLSYKDWLAIEPATSNFLAMAYFYRCTKLMSTIAAAIGEASDSEHYGAISLELQSSINRKYLHECDGLSYYDNASQSADAHGLFFGLCPIEQRQALTEHLVRRIEEQGASTSGFMGTMCLLQALSQNGRRDVAYALLKNPNLGGWIYLLEHCNATTFPERYNGEGSQNHAFLASAPGLWFFKYLVGIAPLEPGYKKVLIEPFIPDDLDFAEASVETPYGIISARWERQNNHTRLHVELPPNVTGLIKLKGVTHPVQSGVYDFAES